MTAVTTILLAVGTEEDEALVPDLNGLLRALGYDDWVLRDLTDAFGGNKVAATLFGGAVNYFDLRSFAGVLQEMPWRKPDALQVTLYDWTDFRWKMFSLAELVQAAADAD